MNCKPGDLAYLIDSDFPSNIGAPVEVLHFDEYASRFLGEPVWFCRSKSGLMSSDGPALSGCAQDRCLRPFAGPSLTHTIDVEIRVKA
jgi:hypothetical protein